MTAAFAQMLDGRPLVFGEPIIEPVHLFTEIAQGLALANRFAGQTLLPYSVAQHSLICAEAALDETGDGELAALCLLHDAHEGAFGDWTRPAMRAVKEAIVRRAPEMIGEARAVWFDEAIADVKDRLDRAILAAADLDPGALARRADEVRAYDERALATERRDLLAPAQRPWAERPDLKPLRTKRFPIRPMPWPDARVAWAAMLVSLRPSAAARSGLANPATGH